MNYSNCLAEALKAWIKDPKNVKIIYLPKKWNHGAKHFLWVKGGKVYHYEARNQNNRKLFIISLRFRHGGDKITNLC